MPVAKIHLHEGRYDEGRLERVSNAIQQAVITELGTPPDDFFQIIHVLQPGQFRHTHSFLGTDLLRRSDLFGAYVHRRPPHHLILCPNKKARHPPIPP